MKVDTLTFRHYVAELRVAGILSRKDECRIYNSLAHKGYGFIHDLCTLANDLRLGVSTGVFSLSEHTNKVFRRGHKSLLPQFLEGALLCIFHVDGRLRDDYCALTVSYLLTFLDSLKRTDPPKAHTERLEKSLWDGLCERFSDVPSVQAHILEQRKSDLSFNRYLQQVRERFRSVLSRAKVDDYVFATGPGANLDKYQAVTSSDWSYTPPEDDMFAWVPTYAATTEMMNRTPFDATPDPWNEERYPLSGSDATMKCSAQRKSYKTLRGVGVMHAIRMAAQLSLQRVFYRDCLNMQMPLTDQSHMATNLKENFNTIGTIDLSAASDRMYWFLLYWLGAGCEWFDQAYALRTQDLKLPGNKYISCASPVMGEAITFPLLSLFCYSVAMAVCDEKGWGHELIRIYGDDVQTPHYYETIRRFEQLGVRVNVTKSYPPTSPFKESCEAHIVSSPYGELVPCRPSYIPSISAEEYLRPVHVLQLLSLSRAAYAEDNTFLCNAAITVVEARSRIRRVPHVHFDSGDYGRPWHRPPRDFSSLQFTFKDTESYEISERGYARHCMRTIGAIIPVDPKVHSKTTFQRKLKTVRSVKVSNALKGFELNLVLRIGEHLVPEKVAEMREAGRTDLDIKSWILSNCDEDDICALIQCYQDIVSSSRLDM